MPSTMTISRRTYRQNEGTGLSGDETVDVENVGIPDQVISAATEEQTALGAFKDHQLQTLCLKSDVDVEAQFLGVRYPIVSLLVAAPDTITYVGDVSEVIFPGDLIRLEGTVANDSIKRVAIVAAALITIEDGLPWTAAGGAAGTFSRVASAQQTGYAYPVLALVALTGAITYTGNVSDKFAAGDGLVLAGTAANDGYWVIDSVTFAAGVTTIIVLNEDGVVGLAANAGAVGTFQKMEPAFKLAANVPAQWTRTSGIQNPFISPNVDTATGPLFNANRGDVSYCMVNNEGAVNANFAGRIGTNAIL